MMRNVVLSSAAALVLATSVAQAASDEQSRFGSLANLRFERGRPTVSTAHTLKDELLFQRNADLSLGDAAHEHFGMKVGAEEAFGTGYNVMPIWEKRSGPGPIRSSKSRNRTIWVRRFPS